MSKNNVKTDQKSVRSQNHGFVQLNANHPGVLLLFDDISMMGHYFSPYILCSNGFRRS